MLRKLQLRERKIILYYILKIVVTPTLYLVKQDFMNFLKPSTQCEPLINFYSDNTGKE